MTPLEVQILTALEHEAMTVTQATDEVGTAPRSTVWGAIDRLHKAGRLRIVGWSTDGKKAPAYRTGAGKDKPKPKTLTEAQRTARYRERHAATIRLKRAVRRPPRSDSVRGLYPVGHFIQLLQK